MMMRQMDFLLLLCGVIVLVDITSGAFGHGSEKVLLSDIQTLTLRHGVNTNGRRSAPVPQLKCIGGSAAGHFMPQVVQCYNRGFDGNDVQWECKTDMDNAYRFGTVEVTCEGYKSSDDPYVLKGSCGLEYTLELTKEGMQQQRGHQYYGDHGYRNDDHSYYSPHKIGGAFDHVLYLALIGTTLFVFYKTCFGTPARSHRRNPSPPRSPQSGFGGHGSSGQGYGFKPEYMPDSDSCSSSRTNTHTSTGGADGGTGLGGFWTGAATGGLLGYMFGNRNSYNTYHRPGYTRSPWGGSTWGGSTWGGSRSSWSGSSPSSGSTGTRTASGFGGTRRR